MCRSALVYPGTAATIVFDDLITLALILQIHLSPGFSTLPSCVCHLARFSRHWSAFGRFFKIRFERFDRSPFSIMLTYLYPTEVPTNVSFRSECSRCLLSKTERWLTIFLDWYVFEPNVKSNLTLTLSLSLSLLPSLPFFLPPCLSLFFTPSLFSGNDHE